VRNGDSERFMPVGWTIVFAVVVLVAGLAIGVIAGYGSATTRYRPERLYLDAVEIPGNRDEWQVRWIEDGLPRVVMVQGVGVRDRLIDWVER